MVPKVGFEPTQLAPLPPQGSVSTIPPLRHSNYANRRLNSKLPKEPLINSEVPRR